MIRNPVERAGPEDREVDSIDAQVGQEMFTYDAQIVATELYTGFLRSIKVKRQPKTVAYPFEGRT